MFHLIFGSFWCHNASVLANYQDVDTRVIVDAIAKSTFKQDNSIKTTYWSRSQTTLLWLSSWYHLQCISLVCYTNEWIAVVRWLNLFIKIARLIAGCKLQEIKDHTCTLEIIRKIVPAKTRWNTDKGTKKLVCSRASKSCQISIWQMYILGWGKIDIHKFPFLIFVNFGTPPHHLGL